MRYCIILQTYFYYNTYHYYSVKVINVTLRTNFARYKEDIATACNIIWAQNSPFLETPIKRKTSHHNPKRLMFSALFQQYYYLWVLVPNVSSKIYSSRNTHDKVVTLYVI